MVVTLLYIASQIRVQIREARVASVHELSEGYRNIVRNLQDPDRARIWLTGMSGLDNLSDTERVQFFAILQYMLRLFEEAYFQYQEERFDPRIWAGFATQLEDVFAVYDGKRSRWVFHHTITQRGAVAGERLQSFHRAFANVVKRAGLPTDLRQHDLRHRRVTTWLAEGKSPALVQKAMGHADLATTMGYTHLLDEHLLPLVEEPSVEELREVVLGS